MFSQACVKNSVHARGGGVHPLGRHPPGRRLLQRTVRILVECILVEYFFEIYVNVTTYNNRVGRQSHQLDSISPSLEYPFFKLVLMQF